MTTRIVYVIRRRNEKGEVETWGRGRYEPGKLTPRTGARGYESLKEVFKWFDDSDYLAPIHITTKKREKLSEVFERMARDASKGHPETLRYASRIAKERGQ